MNYKLHDYNKKVLPFIHAIYRLAKNHKPNHKGIVTEKLKRSHFKLLVTKINFKANCLSILFMFFKNL